jgi:hypothetical protein
VIPTTEHHLIQFAIVATPFLIIIGGMVWDSVKSVRYEQRQQSRVNHPTSKGLPRK